MAVLLTCFKCQSKNPLTRQFATNKKKHFSKMHLSVYIRRLDRVGGFGGIIWQSWRHMKSAGGLIFLISNQMVWLHRVLSRRGSDGRCKSQLDRFSLDVEQYQERKTKKIEKPPSARASSSSYLSVLRVPCPTFCFMLRLPSKQRCELTLCSQAS